MHLHAGQSLLLYGVGDKDGVAEAFASQMLPDARLVIANGYDPKCTLKAILARLGHTKLAGTSKANDQRRLRGGGALRSAAFSRLTPTVDDRGFDEQESDSERDSDDDDGGSVGDAFGSGAAAANSGGAMVPAFSPSVPDGDAGDFIAGNASAAARLSSEMRRVAFGFQHRPITTVLVVRALDQVLQRSQAHRRAGGATAVAQLLEALAVQPSLRLVASVDHVNAPILVDEEATLRGKLVRNGERGFVGRCFRTPILFVPPLGLVRRARSCGWTARRLSCDHEQLSAWLPEASLRLLEPLLEAA